MPFSIVVANIESLHVMCTMCPAHSKYHGSFSYDYDHDNDGNDDDEHIWRTEKEENLPYLWKKEKRR